MFPLQKLYFQCIVLSRFLPVSAFIICTSIALKSPNQGSLTAFYTHTHSLFQEESEFMHCSFIVLSLKNLLH